MISKGLSVFPKSISSGDFRYELKPQCYISKNRQSLIIDIHNTTELCELCPVTREPCTENIYFYNPQLNLLGQRVYSGSNFTERIIISIISLSCASLGLLTNIIPHCLNIWPRTHLQQDQRLYILVIHILCTYRLYRFSYPDNEIMEILQFIFPSRAKTYLP